MKVLATNRERFELFLQKIAADGSLYANVEDEDGGVHFERLPLDQLTRIFLGKARAVENCKAFFFPPRSKVAVYPSSAPDAEITAPLTTVLGLRACGLKALQIQDKVFLEDEVDPFYQARRENSIIITCDCTEPWDTCFCTEVGYRPHPEGGFDLNLCPLDGHILVELGSSKGEALVTEHRDLFTDPERSLLDQRDEQRKAVQQHVRKANAGFNIAAPFQKTVQNQLSETLWAQVGVAYSCVECGACTHVCPTCRCFLLVDQKSQDLVERIQVWDVCFYPGYWRMAGNLSPKPKLLNRFQNRFSCKFDYFVQNYESIACTGCGRCIQACMGKIDIRQCLSELCAAEKVSRK